MEPSKLYKREYTITIYGENPGDIPTRGELHEMIDEYLCSREVDICTTEHRWANNPDDELYCCEIESLYVVTEDSK